MCNWDITHSSFLFVQGQTIQSFKCEKFLCNLFSRNLPHSDCQSSNIYLFTQDFKSEKGIGSFEMSPLWASLAAAEFPLMPTWAGPQIKTISLPSLVSSMYSSKIFTTIGWSYLTLYIAYSGERESDNIKSDFSLECKHVWEPEE